MNLKIFKLRSGEEIICQVVQEEKTKIKISNPLIFKTSTLNDKSGSYDMTVLRDWLANTENKTTSIPKNHIVSELDPKDDTQKLYNLQLESDKSLEEKIVSDDTEINEIPFFDNTPADIDNSHQILEDFMNAIIGDISNQLPKSPFPPQQRKKKKFAMPSPEMNPSEMDRHGIYVSMMIPAESIMNLITAGILDPKDLIKMIKEVKKKNRFTGDEKDRSDFGNKFSDWNPDPESGDYN